MSDDQTTPDCVAGEPASASEPLATVLQEISPALLAAEIRELAGVQPAAEETACPAPHVRLCRAALDREQAASAHETFAASECGGSPADAAEQTNPRSGDALAAAANAEVAACENWTLAARNWGRAAVSHADSDTEDAVIRAEDAWDRATAARLRASRAQFRAAKTNEAAAIAYAAECDPRAQAAASEKAAAGYERTPFDDDDILAQDRLQILATVSHRDWDRFPWDPPSWFHGESDAERLRRLERELEHALAKHGLDPGDISRSGEVDKKIRPREELAHPKSKFWEKYYRDKARRINEAWSDSEVEHAAIWLYAWYRRLGRYLPGKGFDSLERAAARLSGHTEPDRETTEERRARETREREQEEKYERAQREREASEQAERDEADRQAKEERARRDRARKEREDRERARDDDRERLEHERERERDRDRDGDHGEGGGEQGRGGEGDR
jgi:hypothetical protein